MHDEAKPPVKAGGIRRPLRQCETEAAGGLRISERSLLRTGRGAVTIHFQGQSMRVFHQLRGGRFRFYHAAVEDSLTAVVDFWKRGILGSAFTVRPISGQVIGEEVLDRDGRIIAVFGVARTHAFVSRPEAHKEYQEKLTAAIRKLKP